MLHVLLWQAFLFYARTRGRACSRTCSWRCFSLHLEAEDALGRAEAKAKGHGSSVQEQQQHSVVLVYTELLRHKHTLVAVHSFMFGGVTYCIKYPYFVVCVNLDVNNDDKAATISRQLNDTPTYGVLVSETKSVTV